MLLIPCGSQSIVIVVFNLSEMKCFSSKLLFSVNDTQIWKWNTSARWGVFLFPVESLIILEILFAIRRRRWLCYVSKGPGYTELLHRKSGIVSRLSCCVILPSALDSRTTSSEYSCRSSGFSCWVKKIENLGAEKKKNVLVGLLGLLKIWIYFSAPICSTTQKQLFCLEWGWVVKTGSFQPVLLLEK